MDKIYLDQNGYNEYLKEIENIKKKITANSGDITIYQSDDAYGDGWHDNFAYEQAIKKENSLFHELEKKIQGLQNIEIIEETFDEGIVRLNSIVNLIFDDSNEIETFKLIGNTVSKKIGCIQAITLNSPLGKSIYKKIKNERFEYEIGDKKISGYIVDIIND